MNIQISMTKQKGAYENAIAERVNGILKMEFGLDQAFYSFSIALKALEKDIETYNEKRPHMICNMLTPNQAHDENGKLKKNGKTITKSKIEIFRDALRIMKRN